MRVTRARHPRSHLHPPLLRPQRRATPAPARRRLHRRLAALRRDRTPRPARRGHTDALVRHQHASAHRLAAELPDDARSSPPTGSARSARPPSPTRPPRPSAQEKRTNPVLTQDEETYVRELLDGLGAWPAYYAHMAPGQRRRPVRARPVPRADGRRRRAAPPHRGRRVGRRPAQPHRVRRRARAPGTLNFGLDGAFATYLGWLIEWGTPLTLLGETPRTSPPPSASWSGSASTDRPRRPPAAPRTGPTRRARQLPDRDLRRPGPGPPPPRGRSCSTSAAPTSTPAARSRARSTSPLHELPQRLAEVPAGEVWVHCAGGYRAAVAASFLAAAGRTPVASTTPSTTPARSAAGRRPRQ